MTETPAQSQVLPRDLSPCREGNTGIDYMHRFEFGHARPHVMINAPTHGNETSAQLRCARAMRPAQVTADSGCCGVLVNRVGVLSRP